jgi:hypothetical protein
MPKWIVTGTDRTTGETHRRVVEADTQQRAVRLVGRDLFVESAERARDRVRIWRRIFNWACVLSFLLCAAAFFFWIRSFYRWDYFYSSSLDLEGPGQHTIRYFESNCGKIGMGATFYVYAPGQSMNDSIEKSGLGKILWRSDWPEPQFQMKFGRFGPTPQRNKFGEIEIGRQAWDPPPPNPHTGFEFTETETHLVLARIDETKILLPHWYFATAFGPLPLLWTAGAVRRWFKRRRRISENACVICGYDLRGSTGRCPECGNEPVAKVVRMEA